MHTIDQTEKHPSNRLYTGQCMNTCKDLNSLKPIRTTEEVFQQAEASYYETYVILTKLTVSLGLGKSSKAISQMSGDPAELVCTELKYKLNLCYTVLAGFPSVNLFKL